METAPALLVAALLVVLLMVLIAAAWYNLVGWTSFTLHTGDAGVWIPAGGASVARLRFKDCTFTVLRGDNKSAAADVTPVLNGMAAAYAGGLNNPPSLALDRPLNPFSFVIAGFNDRYDPELNPAGAVVDPTAPPWCTAPPSRCFGDADCPAGRGGAPVAGACSARPGGAYSGTCSSCPGGARVVLAGKWRTI